MRSLYSSLEHNEHTAAQWNQYDDLRAWVVHSGNEPPVIVWFKANMTLQQIRETLVYQSGFPFDIKLHRPS